MVACRAWQTANLKGQMSKVANAEPVRFAICLLTFAFCDAAEKFETVILRVSGPIGPPGAWSLKPKADRFR